MKKKIFVVAAIFMVIISLTTVSLNASVWDFIEDMIDCYGYAEHKWPFAQEAFNGCMYGKGWLN